MFSWLNTCKNKIIVFATALGGPGLLLISFLDSSVLTFPIINDLLLINLSIQQPSRMPLYAFLAAFGSVAGCLVLYFIARRGGEALFRKRAGTRAGAIKNWVEKNGFGGMLVAALLPPPTPFKIIVFAAGVFEMPLFSYMSAIALARCIRYFGMGYLAVKFGHQAMPFIAQHKIGIAIGLVFFVAASYLASRMILRGNGKEQLAA